MFMSLESFYHSNENIEQIQEHEKDSWNIDKEIEELEKIDFSLILQQSFHVTIDQNDILHVKKGFHELIPPSRSYLLAENNMETEEVTNDESMIAGHVVTATALQIPRSLSCPFCADEYMFEFTLKDHLKKKHGKELRERFAKGYDQIEGLEEGSPHYTCPFCSAIFYLIGLLPKHIGNVHGNQLLTYWRETGENFEMLNKEKGNEPSIIYAACSPGLSEVFARLDTDEKTNESDSFKIKSILKKTPKNTTNNIINSSPSGISIRRSKSEAVKRSLSVRRELRFDLPTLQQKLPTEVVDLQKSRKLPKLSRIFNLGRRKKSPNHGVTISAQTSTNKQMVTSTPINFLEDDPPEHHFESKKKWKNVIETNKRRMIPLFFASERYQCARCKAKYSSNSDLLLHLNDEHKKMGKNILKPHYKCGQCGDTFFQNSFLVKHCNRKHSTPTKLRV